MFQVSARYISICNLQLQERNLNENQRPLTESSSSSFSSSSCSSSFSSLDCNKTAQSESPPIESTTFPEQSLTNPQKLQNPDIDIKPNSYVPSHPPNASAQFGRQLLDFQDLVKETICRETCGLAVKTRVKEDPVGRVAKHDDSPKPSQLHKSMDKFYGDMVNGAPNMSVDINESLRVLAKLKEAPRYFSKSRDSPRLLCETKDGSLTSRDAPRFSYDGREIPRQSFDSAITCKSTTRLRELPRLSLDSRERLAKSSNLDSKSCLTLKDLHRSKVSQRISNNEELNLQQELASCRRLPCVVAKLMGLETEVNSNTTTPITRGHLSTVKTCLDKDCAPFDRGRNSNCFSKSSRATEENKQDQIPYSPKSTVKDPVSPQLRNRDVITKPISSSRFPIEPAPWKQQDNCRSPQKTAYGKREACSASPPSKGTGALRTVESSIVIMKPEKSIDRSTIHSSAVIPIDRLSIAQKFKTINSNENKKHSVHNRTAKDLSRLNLQESAKKTKGSTDENNSQKIQLRETQISPRTIHLPRENAISSTGNSGSLSPRVQQKKTESERRSYLPIPLPDLSKSRRKPVRQQPELGSPGGKVRPKAAKALQSDDQLSAISYKMINLSYQGGDLPLQPDNNISLASQRDIEVTKADGKISSLKQKKASSLKEDGSLAELGKVTTEQPSPISVLDGSFYRDDLPPSPMKMISNAFKDDNTRNTNGISSEEEWNLMGLHHLSDVFRHDFSSKMNHNTLENIHHLVQTDRQLNLAHNESTAGHISSPCKTIKVDHRYVSKILLASGLLPKDIRSGHMPIQPHPVDHPINPELFFILERTKANWHSKDNRAHKKAPRSTPDQEKLHRKLLFDTVNEVLVQKLRLEGPQPDPWLRANNLSGGIQCWQRLLRELYSEIERLQVNGLEGCVDDEDDWLNSIITEDVMRRGGSWTEFHKEIADVVLDVERLIFKDLIDEIVSSEALTFRANPNSRHRQLFFN